jgi:hypothetical protein
MSTERSTFKDAFRVSLRERPMNWEISMLMIKRQALLLSLVVCTSITALPQTAAASIPTHLSWALDIESHVAPENNDYATSPSYIHWAGSNGSTIYENRTVCATFVTAVLMQAYGWDTHYFQTWMGTNSPSAAVYYAAIVAKDGFTKINKVTDIQPGDLVAVKFPSGSYVTGHMMTATANPILRVATKPIINGTTQWEVPIVDSSRSYHGPGDTRIMPDGSIDRGVGAGSIRIYTDSMGAYKGYTWSVDPGSLYYTTGTRPIAVGRLQNIPGVADTPNDDDDEADEDGDLDSNEPDLNGDDSNPEPEL